MFLLPLVSSCCCHCSSCCLLAYEVIATLFVPLLPMLLSSVNVQISLLPLLTCDCCHLSTLPVFCCLSSYAVIATHGLSPPILCVLLPLTTRCCYHFLAVIVANIIVVPLLTWCCPFFMLSSHVVISHHLLLLLYYSSHGVIVTSYIWLHIVIFATGCCTYLYLTVPVV